MKVFNLISILLLFNICNAQDRQRYQTSSPTFVQNKIYTPNSNINDLQQLLNEKKKDDWDTNIPLAQQYYNDGKYVECINIINDVLYRTSWTNPFVFYMLGDSYKNIKYYKSAKKYLNKAKKGGNSQATFALAELKKSYKENKSTWLKK